jgi:hypothetical protein
MLKFYEIVDRESVNPSLSRNGGDYDFWRVVAVQDGAPIAVSYRTGADVDYYCAYCGDFGHMESECWRFGADLAEVAGWENGRLLTGEEAERELRFLFGSGWFNPIRW